MRTFTCANSCTKKSPRQSVFLAAGISVLVLLSTSLASADWAIDFSRRNLKTREADLNAPAAVSGSRGPASVGASDGARAVEPVDTTATAERSKTGVLETFFDSGEPIQDLVILHTDKGFIPSTVRVRKGGRYKIHVVNVNEKEKNVSFMLDGFSEHHATYFGKIKVFVLEPKKEGTYSFQSPETSSEGKMVVFSAPTSVRVPSSEE